jgi:hypothetical protein
MNNTRFVSSLSLAFTLCCSTLAPFASCTCAGPADVGEPLAPLEALPPGVDDPVDGVDDDDDDDDDDDHDDDDVLTPGAVALYVAIGDDVPPAIAARIPVLLAQASQGAGALPVLAWSSDLALPVGARVLSFGDTPVTAELIAPDAVTVDEAFVIASGAVGNAQAMATDGAGLGVAFGAYALLEELGFAFMHPLAPTVPSALSFPVDLSVTSAPRWPHRNWHMHSMHPLELTDLVNGWGPLGIDDAIGWEAMLPEWELFCEWLIANRQNEVEWNLLEADTWAEFSQSDTRLDRLSQVVERTHAFGLRAGVDVPIALIQQHTFRLLLEDGELDDELAQIRARADWLMQAGFDFLSTENGSTEFTHPDPARMLAWMNELARHLDEQWGAESHIKVHVSHGQTADGFLDPSTGEPLDFNHLPHYADARLGILPHTVQHYGLDDPAPTYGNTGFSHVRDFIHQEAGRRRVLWHPETAYWVSFDVDVPLFLPVYAERRLSDLRLLARDEDAGLMGRGEHAGAHMDGQSVFSSGWEWGYWLNDVVAARASWDPLLHVTDARAAFIETLRPLSRALGTTQVAETLADAAIMQRELLILGRVNGNEPVDVVRRNGQAYLQGVEAFDDLMDAAGDVLPIEPPVTQPDKLGLVEMLNPLHAEPAYTAEVAPLLAAMEQRFDEHADALESARPLVRSEALDLFDDLVDAARITALRAAQVRGLYDYADGYWDSSDAQRAPHIEAARTALDQAALIVAQRELRYRVPTERIASWRENPTAYEFTYLWTVHSLYFWWRDELKAVEAPFSPCVLNIINPADVALGEGALTDGVRLVRDLTEDGAFEDLTECLAEPAGPPTLPPVGLRD